MTLPDKTQCNQAELVCAYALRMLTPGDVPRVEAHISTCADCQQEMQTLRSILDSLSQWPTEIVRPSNALWNRLLERIAQTEGRAVTSSPRPWSEPDWEEAAPGISCKVLASNDEDDRVTMLVRLAPGVEYPPHQHAGVEELHLLHGELWINDRKLSPGDYNRAEPGTADHRVWSATGCTCLLITSPSDVLR